LARSRRSLAALLLPALLISTELEAAPIRVVRCFREVLPSLASDSVLVLDLDNTVIEPTGSLGSDQWFYHVLRRYRERDRLSAAEAQRKAVLVWNQVQWLVKVRPVEPELPRLIRAQQERGVRTLGLTARDGVIAARTAEQLASIGVRLDRRGLAAGRIERGGVRFRNGILYAGEGQDKGELLVRFLRDHLKLRPRKIVFVDDKRPNVEDVERALRKHALPSELFHYTAADPRVEAFQGDVADLELFANGVLGPAAREAIRRARTIKAKPVDPGNRPLQEP
jgi:hypothetical protein